MLILDFPCKNVKKVPFLYSRGQKIARYKCLKIWVTKYPPDGNNQHMNEQKINRPFG